MTCTRSLIVLVLGPVIAFATPTFAITKNGAIRYVKARSYLRSGQMTLDPGFCDCAIAACDSDNDLRVNCGGGFIPFPSTQGAITAIGAVPGQPTACGACGCNVSESAAALGAEIICISVP